MVFWPVINLVMPTPKTNSVERADKSATKCPFKFSLRTGCKFITFLLLVLALATSAADDSSTNKSGQI